jgi:endoglucanase
MRLFGGSRNGRPSSSGRGRVLAGVAGVMGLIALAAGLAFAYWVTTDSSNPAAASATSLSAPTAATATEVTASSVKISWTNPGTQVTGAQYEVIRNPGASQVVVCTVSAPTSSCTDTNLSAGTSYSYSVIAVLDLWQSTAAGTSFTAMTVNVTYPVNGTTYGANWTPTLTGTASAATGTTISASGVKVSVQQGSGTSSCWTGSGATFTASCPNYVTASYSSGSWTLGLPAGDLTSGDTYKVTAQATDSLGASTTSSTVSFTYTVPAPIASAPGASATTSYSTAPIWFDKEPVTLTDSPSVNGGTAVASVTYYYCLKSNSSCTNTSTANWTPINTSTASGSNWTLTWASASLPADGTYNLMATATNSSSVTSGPSSTSTEIGIDNTPPSVSTPIVNGVS